MVQELTNQSKQVLISYNEQQKRKIHHQKMLPKLNRVIISKEQLYIDSTERTRTLSFKKKEGRSRHELKEENPYDPDDTEIKSLSSRQGKKVAIEGEVSTSKYEIYIDDLAAPSSSKPQT